MTEKRAQEFRAASRKYSDASIFMHEAIARKAGLSGADHKYLGLILQKQQVTAGELSKLTGLTTGAITGLIDRLENKKLVKRQFSNADRRKVIIVPNEENTRKLLAPLFADLQEKTLKLVRSFTETELQVVERYFNEAVKIMIDTTEKLNKK
ncbi:MAG: MarR family transcriptional regulator [Marivirga sp.]|nr:MarR family transcriptional regulator [Marivirga sp.]